MDDAQAIRRLKDGDIGGLELLIARYQLKAVRTAFLITHDEYLAEDVVQDVFIRFYERIELFDEKRAFEPYFLRSVVNAALNAAKKASRTQALADDDTQALETLLEQGSQVETQVERLQVADEVLAALAKLSPRQRAVIIQRYYLGLSEADMADRLEIAPGTVKWQLHAARTRLKTLLGVERSAE
jgi:RNA polymerase sigma-70 factor (ECF subfamily)